MSALRVLLLTAGTPTAAAVRLRGALEARGHDVGSVEGVGQTGTRARQLAADVVLVDDGAADAAAVRAAFAPVAVLTVSEVAAPAATLVVENAAEVTRSATSSARLQRRLAFCEPEEPFLTDDSALKEAVTSLERLANGVDPVLFQGERGTGRELLARSLYRRGDRSAGPFVVHDPARAQGTADGGLLDLADDGVLFVRGIEHLSEDLQAELVRIVDHPRPPFRLMASTTSNPDSPGQSGNLQRDLAARLTSRFHVPPLRDRRGDVGLLAGTFAERVAGRRLTPAAVVLLQKQAWPGNVRELKLVVERAALVSARDPLEPEDLLLPGEATWADAARRRGLTLAEVEEEYIQAVLASHDGHRGHTARTLGIDPKTLYNKLGTERPRKAKP